MIFDDLENKLKIFNSLNNYYFEIGILDEDRYRTVEVNVLNTDDSITKIEMQLEEVLYLTEHGTMTIPPRPILQNTFGYISNKLKAAIDEIFIGVFSKNWTEREIEVRLRDLERQIEAYIQNQASAMVSSNATLANIINVKDENKYLYDLNKLKSYIKCRIIKKF